MTINLVFTYRKKISNGIKLKTWGSPTTIPYNDCTVCLVQGIETESFVFVEEDGEEKNMVWRKKTELSRNKEKNYVLGRKGKKYEINHKIFNYHSIESFNYEPILFDELKNLGFNPMHKRIRVVENMCHMCEHKWARTHFYDIYCGDKYVKSKTKDTRIDAVKIAHEYFKNQFLEQLGVKYFVPDPINGNFDNLGTI